MGKELKNYLPVNRKFFEHPFWSKERVYSEAEAWLYLLKEARFEVSEASSIIKGKIVRWGRGEMPASLRYLAVKWSWDKNKVDRFLKLLVREGMIKSRTADGTDQTIITLCNYDSYNGSANFLGQQPGQQRDTGGTATGQQRDNTNTVNNGNNGKKENKTLSAVALSEFEIFWNAYGKKTEKEKCMKVWQKLSEDERATAVKAAAVYAASTPDIKYRKNPQTWLNGKCWEDEVLAQVATNVKFLNTSTGTEGTMSADLWNQRHANNPDSSLKFISA